MNLQLSKGTRDFRPEEALVRNKIISTLRQVFELYGYSPLDTPIIERYDMLASKYAGGDEILKETFKFKDQGKRELALRYDLTVPLARYIGMNPNVKIPFKRYQFGEVFRDGPVESSRYRQFSQCDVDVIGINDMTADAELITLAARAFKKLVFAVEPFASSGAGIVQDSGVATVYMLVNKKPVRNVITRQVLKEIESYENLPFTTRWLTKKLGAKAKFGLREMEQLGIIHSYPPLADKDKGMISQAEHTVLVDNGGEVIITTKL